jgi:hypothetical protein
METTIPLFPCKSLAETLTFYRALGFEVTHEQSDPYIYSAVRSNDVQLHFASLRVYGAQKAFGASLVFVPDIEGHHKTFAGGLRATYGKVPTDGFPRITRLRTGDTRFKLFDPTGNMLIYIRYDEPEMDYGAYDATLSGLMQAMENVVFLRDTYSNDKAAARALDTALKRFVEAEPLERARALAARAELAVAMGDHERAEEVQAQLRQIPLTAEDRIRFQEELEAAERLAHWIENA